MTKITCPVCKGEGFVQTPKKQKAKTKEMAIRSLVDAGFSYREIIGILGYRSVTTVTRAMKK
jgi:hypothetical protein